MTKQKTDPLTMLNNMRQRRQITSYSFQESGTIRIAGYVYCCVTARVFKDGSMFVGSGSGKTMKIAKLESAKDVLRQFKD